MVWCRSFLQDLGFVAPLSLQGHCLEQVGILIHSSFIYWTTLRGYPFCAWHCAGPGSGMVSHRDTVPLSWSLHSTLLGTQKGTDCGLDHQIL